MRAGSSPIPGMSLELATWTGTDVSSIKRPWSESTVAARHAVTSPVALVPLSGGNLKLTAPKSTITRFGRAEAATENPSGLLVSTSITVLSSLTSMEIPVKSVGLAIDDTANSSASPKTDTTNTTNFLQ
jgi:hypothetical protein